MNQLESDGTATFHFIHGLHTAVPPEGYEDFFGGPPFFRWLEESKDPEGVDGLERIRDFPAGASPEDTLRLFNPLGSSDGLAVTAIQALEHLRDIVQKHGPFEGIIGYSEGALMAGTLIMKEEEFRANGDYSNKFKLAMFFGGWPPLKPDLKGMMLSDETDLQLTLSTIHVSEYSPVRYYNSFLLKFCWENFAVGMITLTSACDKLVRWILISTARWRSSMSVMLIPLLSLTMPKGTLCLGKRTL